MLKVRAVDGAEAEKARAKSNIPVNKQGCCVPCYVERSGVERRAQEIRVSPSQPYTGIGQVKQINRLKFTGKILPGVGL